MKKSPYASLAQLAEHVTFNHGVVGSSPSGGAKMSPKIIDFGAFFHAKMKFSEILVAKNTLKIWFTLMRSKDSTE